MTAGNLAVIFGPNLLQKERGSERELSPQALGIEDSSAVISVTLLLIQNHKHLFMVREMLYYLRFLARKSKFCPTLYTIQS